MNSSKLLESEEVVGAALRPKSLVREEKRHDARMQRAYLVHAVTFCVLLIVVGALSLILPKPTVSEVEKRELAGMPDFSVNALVEGSYTKDLELHYADTFPMRDSFVTFAAALDEMRGVRFDDVRIYGVAPQPTEEPAPNFGGGSGGEPGQEGNAGIPFWEIDPSKPEESSPEQQESSQPEQPRDIYREVDDGALGEQNGAVFVYKEKGMSMFGGSNAMGEWYAQVINAYQERWGDSVQVYNIVIPTAIEFALPERYKKVTSPQKPNIDHIYESLNEKVRGVDAYTEIGIHANEYVYFNADHHWTGLGAYYAYAAFCKSAEIEPLKLTDYETRRIEDFYGTMYTYTNDAKLAADYVDYYIMPVECTAVRYDKGAPYNPIPHSVWAEYAKSPNCYAVFLHGDFPLIKISTEAKTGRKALIVKESFGNAFAPFLIPHYDEVYVVDQRYFELNLTQFVKDNGIQDVLFVNNIFAANTKYHIECIQSMM